MPVISRSLAQSHNRNYRILISGMGSHQAAIAFLIAEHISVLLVLLKEFNLFSDIFKAGKGLHKSQAIIFCNFFRHFSGYYGSHYRSVLWQSSQSFSLGKNVFQNQGPGHISCKAFVLSGSCILSINAKTVCIRVCSQNQIRIFFPGQLQSQLKCVFIFRIGIGNRREVSVRQFLLFHHINLCKAQLFKNPPDRKIPGSMKRGIHNLQVFGFFTKDFRMKHKALQGFYVFIIHFRPDNLVQPCFPGLFQTHGFYSAVVGYLVHFLDNLLVPGAGNLGPILPVHFVTIIFRRIMTGCHYDSCGTAQLSQGKRQHRGGTQGGKNIGFDSICRQT